MRGLVLLGGGGHCKSVLDSALSMGCYDKIAVLDPGLEVGTIIMGCIVVGDDEKLIDLNNEGYEEAFVAVGNMGDSSIRKKLVRQAEGLRFRFPNIIDPSAIVSKYARLGCGIFIGKNAVVNAGADIAGHVIINTAAIIEHNCSIGEFSHVAVGAAICGDCKLGSDVFVGAGATVVQGVDIESGRFIKAGEVVKK